MSLSQSIIKKGFQKLTCDFVKYQIIPVTGPRLSLNYAAEEYVVFTDRSVRLNRVLNYDNFLTYRAGKQYQSTVSDRDRLLTTQSDQSSSHGSSSRHTAKSAFSLEATRKSAITKRKQ